MLTFYEVGTQFGLGEVLFGSQLLLAVGKGARFATITFTGLLKVSAHLSLVD